MNKMESKLMWSKQKERRGVGGGGSFWIKHSLKKGAKSEFLGPNLSLQALHC